MSNPAFSFDHVHIISEHPRQSAEWYVEMFGATIAKDTVARGAPQIFVELGGMTILIRGRRPGEIDRFHWYCPSCGGFLHEETFVVDDYTKDPVSLAYKRFFDSVEARTCKACGTVMPAP